MEAENAKLKMMGGECKCNERNKDELEKKKIQ